MAEYYINRKWVDAEQAAISLHDAGFLRGDGIFETVALEGGGLFRLDDHLERMFQGLKMIRIRSNESQGEIAELVREYVRRNSLREAVIRIIITRGIYTGMPWEHTGLNSIYITHKAPSQLPDPPAKIVYLDETKYPLIRRHPAVKSLNYLGNMLAKMDAQEAGAFEPVMYNADGYITEGGIRNIFYVREGTVLTPPTSLGILPGTMRDAVIEVARREDIPVEETLIRREEVDTMDEAFITSTGIKILPVTWNNWNGDFVVTSVLSSTLNTFIKEERTVV
ncbi:MAG: aminotransferase class IV [Candidatus Marinimicrobia bacterium]|nr:aminotransferase class IV [Candidatus Neomarinimicrobiota bacterium]MCF7827963.1 aminotransferase class IV [Candidatus Neomarinimicrobiota bacterium]MCF7879282.1 aminotransferase class IV [Candidatus Neomarinimicrobiota bacterium]